MSATRLRIVHTESSCGWGGQEVRILTESLGMMERGHDVHLVCCPESIIAERAKELGVPVTELPIRRRNFKGLAAARLWLSRREVDVINTHSSSDSWLFTLASRSLVNRPRIVRTRHIGAPVKPNPGSNWIFSQGADFVVTCGNNMRAALVKNNGVQQSRSASIPTGIDLERFTPGNQAEARQQLELPQDATIVGIVAALRREKGHEYLCRALKQIEHENLKLLIVGDGLSRDLVRGWIAENDLTEKAILVGNQSDVVPYLHAMDLFVLPSWGVEGVPQSIMQAMSCQLPVVASRIGSIEQAVDHEQTGFLVAPRDEVQLSQAIKELLDSPKRRAQFAARGREKALTEFGIARMLDRMEEVFSDIAAPVKLKRVA